MPITAFEIADSYVDDICAIDPMLCTQLGIPGSDHRWGNVFGLAGIEARRELRQSYRGSIGPFLEVDSRRDRLTARVMTAAFDEADDAYDHGDHFRELRHLGSPFHRIRTIFDLMPVTTADQVDNIVSRLHSAALPLADYRDLLVEGVGRGVMVSGRQVQSVIEQAKRQATDPASFDAIVGKVSRAGHDPGPVATAAETARAAIGEFGIWLETDYLPHAREEDAAGVDIYERAASRLVGMSVHVEQAYRWGWDEFARLQAEMQRVAEEIIPGVGIEAVKEYLETDPGVTASGTDELLGFVTEILERAVDELAGTHFDVPDQIRPLTVQLAPPGSPLGVYYIPPSEDFSRPGGVWYSIGDQQRFPLYQHVSTAYHEGFPGHHLQIATAMVRHEEISRFQRVLTWYPGYGEGWGMYAETLMGELGYLADPKHYFGMLAKQMYRATRVVVDIGLHLEWDIDPAAPLAPGETWSFDTAVEYMRVYGFRTPAQARDEVLRYLGWPGQAIAYKLGEREILAVREETRRRLGDRFDLRQFHSTVLGHGAMRLDLLTQVVRDLLS